MSVQPPSGCPPIVDSRTVNVIEVPLNLSFAFGRGRLLLAAICLVLRASVPAEAQSLTVTSVTPSQSYPLVGGTPVTWTVSVADASGPVGYKFYMYKRTAWVLMQDYGSSNTLAWTPQPGDEGTPYSVQVWVRLVGSTAAYDAYGGTPSSFEVLPAPIRLTANVDFPTPVGNTVTWTASTSETASPEYEFRVFDQSASVWSVFRSYATTAQAQWTPQANGTYMILNRAGFVGGLIQREDGAHGTSQQVFAGVAGAGGPDGQGARPGYPSQWATIRSVGREARM